MSDSDEKDLNSEGDDTIESGASEGIGLPLIDTVKKLFSVGIGAAFMSEEGILRYLADLKLPKDVLQFVLQGANKGKEEIVQRVSKEIGGLLSHIDFVREMSRFAENHKFKITAEIEITPKKKADKE